MSEPGSKRAPRDSARVIAVVSVDWEGDGLLSANKAAMKSFCEALPSVPITHFLSAAYYSLGAFKPSEVDAFIHDIHRPDKDELGLHVHCLEPFIKAAGVEPLRTVPHWGDVEHEQEQAQTDAGDGPYTSGAYVALGAYREDQIERVIRYSERVLAERGFSMSKIFRCGGWMATPNVREALMKCGYEIDSSAVPADLIHQPLRSKLAEVWPDVTEATQPFELSLGSTGSTSSTRMLEIPDTCALADYVDAPYMDAHMEAALRRASPEAPRFVQFGFHQETAEEWPRGNPTKYIDEVAACLMKYRDHPEIEFVTLSEAAAKWRSLTQSGSIDVRG